MSLVYQELPKVEGRNVAVVDVILWAGSFGTNTDALDILQMASGNELTPV